MEEIAGLKLKVQVLSALSAIALKGSYDWRRLKSVTLQQDDLRYAGRVRFSWSILRRDL